MRVRRAASVSPSRLSPGCSTTGMRELLVSLVLTWHWMVRYIRLFGICLLPSNDTCWHNRDVSVQRYICTDGCQYGNFGLHGKVIGSCIVPQCATRLRSLNWRWIYAMFGVLHENLLLAVDVYERSIRSVDFEKYPHPPDQTA